MDMTFLVLIINLLAFWQLIVLVIVWSLVEVVDLMNIEVVQSCNFTASQTPSGGYITFFISKYYYCSECYESVFRH